MAQRLEEGRQIIRRRHLPIAVAPQHEQQERLGERDVAIACKAQQRLDLLRRYRMNCGQTASACIHWHRSRKRLRAAVAGSGKISLSAIETAAGRKALISAICASG